ncbi:hypothetical protein [Aquitalea pelogenes]|uniref:hypothetical protein n=1 Tax=Aquitalea pelogenes TaxID=1293573 RepID=UPI0035B0E0E1
MKKLLLVLCVALMGNAFAKDTATLVGGSVYVNNNECKYVNYFYREYFKPTKSQVADYKAGKTTSFFLDEEGAYRGEAESPTVMGVQGDALLLKIADYISQGATVTIKNDTCTFIVKDKKFLN